MILTAEKFILSKLKGDTTLASYVGTRIYTELAPKGATAPFVIVQHQGGQSISGVGGSLIMLNETYVVKIVTNENSYKNTETAVARINTLLHKSSGAISGGYLLSCIQEYPVKYTTHEDGVTYRHLGYAYNLNAQ